MKAVFFTLRAIFSIYPLKNSMILDLGIILYIFNNINRIITYRYTLSRTLSRLEV